MIHLYLYSNYRTILLVLLVLVHQIVGQIEVPPLDCDNVCGIKSTISSTPLPNFPVEKEPRLPEICGEELDPEIESWTNSSRLFLSFIGMNDSTFACPAINSYEITPNVRNVLRREPQVMSYFRYVTGRKVTGSEISKRLTAQSNILRMDEPPDDIKGYCITHVQRGVLRRTSSNPREYITDWLISHKLGASDKKRRTSLGWLFAFFADGTGKPRSITLPGESVPYSLFWLNSKLGSNEEVYSMFADWTFEDLPDMRFTLGSLQETVDKLENIANEVSSSNIAILCLPLLMAIPPVSLLESVSDKLTAWYVFATDILATVPLLIKGFELIVGDRTSEGEAYTGVDLIGEQFGIFERWYVLCRPNETVRRFWIGVALVAIALYFMVASTYAEFLFWRAMKYRQNSQNERDNIDVEGAVLDEEHEKLNTLQYQFLFWRAIRNRRRRRTTNKNVDSVGRETDTENVTPNKDVDTGRKAFRFSRSVIRKVVVLLLSIGAVFALAFALMSSVVARVALPILLVLIRGIGMKRLTQFRRWTFLVGIAFGFVGGPIYLLLHALEKVRKSENWGDVSDGASIGLATLALTMAVLFVPFGIWRTAIEVTIFPLCLGFAGILVDMLRSTSEDRKGWRYGVHGFASGMVFGPFGFLFSRCFPEMQQKERAKFVGASAFGLVVTTCSIILVLSLSSVFWFPHSASYNWGPVKFEPFL